jgi:hypothetical protein
MRWASLLVTMAALAGCNREAEPGAVSACDVARSPDACLRCQARECPAALDQCYGARLRLGHDLPACPLDGDAAVSLTTYFSNDPRSPPRTCEAPLTPRCRWNEATQAYDKDCVQGSAPADCADFTRCYQACGCGSDCAPSCARFMTTGCAACLGRAVTGCATTYCAQECGA